jgi:deoxyhypusine synthase
MSGQIKSFLKHHYRHFNAATVVDAAEAYIRHLDRGGKMLLTLAGAMSTAELGVSLAEMIRQGKVHAICCTAANLEEDIFNLVAHDHYIRVPNYRDLSPGDEVALLERGMNRVTDTCIPEEEAMRRIERALLDLWRRAEQERKSYFPFEYFYQLVESGAIEPYYQIDPADSWVVAACQKKLTIYTPGWEDSTLANMYVGQFKKGALGSLGGVRSGLDQMSRLVDWYRETAPRSSIGFFQIGGGIAGDFPICVVPLIRQDIGVHVPCWGYFCQISDSTTSYGSYSGAAPNEKITWEKLECDTPKFVIESDATIVAPLVFAYVLGL